MKMVLSAAANEGELVPISALMHMLYCPRRCALIHTERQWSENRFTAEGRILHERVDAGGRERRPKVTIERSVRLRSMRLGVSGIADLVEIHAGNRATVPIPSSTNVAGRTVIARTRCSSVRKRSASRRCSASRFPKARSSTGSTVGARWCRSMANCANSPKAWLSRPVGCSPPETPHPPNSRQESATGAHCRKCVIRSDHAKPSIGGLSEPSMTERCPCAGI